MDDFVLEFYYEDDKEQHKLFLFKIKEIQTDIALGSDLNCVKLSSSFETWVQNTLAQSYEPIIETTLMNIEYQKTEGNSSVNFSIDNDMTVNVKDLYLLNIQKLVKTIERLKNGKNFLGSNIKDDDFEKTRLINQTGVDL